MPAIKVLRWPNACYQFRDTDSPIGDRVFLCLLASPKEANRYNLQYLRPAVSTVVYYVTYLAKKFTSAQSVHNYVSGIRTMHRTMGLEATALDSYPISCLL